MPEHSKRVAVLRLKKIQEEFQNYVHIRLRGETQAIRLAEKLKKALVELERLERS